jgi:hypothetical protein
MYGRRARGKMPAMRSNSESPTTSAPPTNDLVVLRRRWAAVAGGRQLIVKDCETRTIYVAPPLETSEV